MRAMPTGTEEEVLWKGWPVTLEGVGGSGKRSRGRSEKGKCCSRLGGLSQQRGEKGRGGTEEGSREGEVVSSKSTHLA